MFRERGITWCARLVGFLLPIQTVLILEPAFIGGEPWQWATTRIFLSSIVGAFFAITVLRIERLSPYRRGSWRGLCLAFLLITLLIPFNLISLILLFQWAIIITLCIVAHKTPYGKDMLWGMASVVIISIFLAIPQVLTGHQGRSVILGISEQNAQEPGAFVVLFDHLRILRGSGIFQHPNIFGAWCALLVWLGLRLKNKIGWLVASVGMLGVGLSMSRSALLMVVIIFCLTMAWKKLRYGIIPLIIFGAVRFFDGFSGQGVSERLALMREWWSVFKHSWIFGTGIGGYTEVVLKLFPSKTGFTLQPVHNTFLLVLAELGVVRILGFGFLLFWRGSKRLTPPNLPFAGEEPLKRQVLQILILLPPLLFDHFLWTTYSGSSLVLFWVLIFTTTQKKS